MKLRNLLFTPGRTQTATPAGHRANPSQARTSILLGLLLPALFLAGTTESFGQCELACRQNAPIVLAANGEATVTAADVLNNYPDPDCPGDILVTLTSLQGVPVSNPVDCSFAGDTLLFTAFHLASTNSCWGTVIIRDDSAPALTCPELTVWCSDSLKANVIGYPSFTENCAGLSNADLVHSDQFVNLPCSTMVNGVRVTGKVERSWSLTDKSGNKGTCQQIIWLRTATIEDITFPADRDGYDAPALDCSQSAKDLKLTGQPTVNGFPIRTLGLCDFVVDTFDNVYNECIGGAYITVRTWRVIDYCRDTTIYHAQAIHRVDAAAPSLFAPADITIGTSAKTCDAPVNLPTSWAAKDTCSSFSVTASWQFGTGFGPFIKVPKGTYPAYYFATDACGNVATDTMFVTVIDDDKPTAVCKKDVNIALPSTGIITVPADLFDDGSHDNCALDHLEVSRDLQPFGTHATFSCADVGASIMVVLKAIDEVGLTNTCMMLVQVQDKLAPMVSCPNDLTVSCTTDIKNLNLLGAAVGTDNCQMKSVTYTDTKFLNQCQSGTVNRIWSAEDIYGNKSACLQVLTLTDLTAISIQWPANFSSTTCGQNVSPSVTGEPVVSGKDCENLFINYTDKIFKAAYPACYRIERCWEIKEWCSYNPNMTPNPGLWTMVQYIDVYDQEAPVLKAPADITIGTTDTDCHGVLVIADATVTDCNPNAQITNNSIYAYANGASANGIYPVGVHTIMFTATDGCGNSSMATMKVTVVDNKPPLAICNNGVTIGLNANGVALLPVHLIDNHSKDNCTPLQALTFAVTPNTFNCDSLGARQVTLQVTDALGNVNSCKTTVVIQDNLSICGTKTIVSGTVNTGGGSPVEGVELMLNGIDPVETDASGTFVFPDLSMGSSYTIAPEKDKDPLNGVSVADIIALQKHILGKKLITDPYLLIAGDLNLSGSITLSDMIEVRKLLLGQQSGFSQVPSWQFVDASYTFKNPKKPTQEPFPKEILIQSLSGNMSGQNFVAIKSGDLNQTAKTSGLLASETRNDFRAEILLEDLLLEAGKTYRIPVRVSADAALTGLQWEILVDGQLASLEGAVQGNCPSVTPEMLRTDGIGMRLVWNATSPEAAMESEPLAVMILRSATQVRLSEVLRLGEGLAAEAVDAEDLEARVSLRFLDPAPATTHASMEAVRPNPFREETNVTVNLDRDETVTLRVFDLLGRQVWTQETDLPRGSHRIAIPGNALGRSGTYRLTMETPSIAPISQHLVLINE